LEHLWTEPLRKDSARRTPRIERQPKRHVTMQLALALLILPAATLRPTASRPTSFLRVDSVTYPQREECDVVLDGVGCLLSEIGHTYQSLVKEHYLPMAFFQAAVLAAGADIGTQTLEQVQFIDWSHVTAMSTVASTMSGGANAVWLRQLEDKFPGRATDAIVKKTLIHAVILASIINSAYLAGVPALTDIYSTGLPVTEGVAGWDLPEFWTLTKLEVCMFIPYNTLAFSFVPPQIRPLTHAMVSATFNVAVSAVTLGYFDAWVDHAMHLVQ
jgi:hypothetical protein